MERELKALKEISEVNGKGSNQYKALILKRNFTDNMKYLLDIAYNPFITTKLSKFDIIESDDKVGFNGSEFKSIMHEFITAKSANNELREKIGKFVGSLNIENDLRDILYAIITKNLVIGIKIKSINDAVGYEFLPNMSVMLASQEDIIEHWSKIYCEVKYDGVRVITTVKNGEIKFFSRNFNEVDASCLTKIANDIKLLVNGNLNVNLFFDGELTSFDRKTVSGQFNKILKGTAPKNIDDNFVYNVFDFETLDTLNGSKGTVPYTTRRKQLEMKFDKANLSKHTVLGKMYAVNSKTEVLEIYDRVVEEGGEGVICKDEHFYETKRSKHWVKFKQIQDCDLKVVGFIDGEGKREGYIGSLICESADGLLKVNVGSGFSDDELEQMNDRIKNNNLINKIAVIRYNERITDKYGNNSLFLPRFVEIREDKTEADLINKIN